MSENLTARRVNATGRSTGKFLDPKFRKLNSVPKGQAFVWFTREMVESPAWRAMPDTTGRLHLLRVVLLLTGSMPMSATKRQPAPKTSASFTSWKLRLLKAASADPRIPPTYFRFLVRVIEALNEETRIAMIGDDVIADEVPGFGQQSTRNRARRALAELGYLSYEAGQGSKVTRYRISDEPVPAIMVAIEEARERRAAEREARKQAFRDQSNPALVQGTDGIQPCKSHLPKPAPVQGVHLHSTPSPKGYREEDVTPGVRASMPASARAISRLRPPPPPPEDDDDLIEVAPARSGPAIRQVIPPPPEDDDWDDYASPSSTANDPGADYKRVRDGG